MYMPLTVSVKLQIACAHFQLHHIAIFFDVVKGCDVLLHVLLEHLIFCSILAQFLFHYQNVGWVKELNAMLTCR